MRVVNVIRTSVGGLWIADQLGVLVDRGHKVRVILPDPADRLGVALRDRGVEAEASVVPLDDFGRAMAPWNIRRLRHQILDLSPDVVVYQLIQTAILVRLALASSGVVKVHQVPGPLYLDNLAIRAYERYACRQDDVIIGGSDFTLKEYQRISPGHPRVVSIPFGVDTLKFTAVTPSDRAKARARMGYAPTDFVLVMVAYAYAPKRLVYRGLGLKGHETLIGAWQEFSERHPDSHLLVVGDGFGARSEAYRNRLEQSLVATARAGSVRWVTGQTKVSEYYACADVSVSPSLSENHGAAVEASALGIPSIVSDAGGLPEVVSDREGWVFARGDVDGLVAQLEAAYETFLEGRLGAKGRAAREKAVGSFDRTVCARLVADEIERSVRSGRETRSA